MHRTESSKQLPTQIKAVSWIAKNELRHDIAIVQCSTNTISVGDLRKALALRDACRWVLFVHGPARTESIVARAAMYMPEAEGVFPEHRRFAIDELPVDNNSSFLRAAQKPAHDDEHWWTEPPRTPESMDTYARAATEFLHDIRSARPLGTINRCGLWITLRAVAATGDHMLLTELLDRFHSALLYDLRHGAHRFSPHLKGVVPTIPAAPPGTIAAITPERPMVTLVLRAMFPTDVHFGALPFESIDCVAPLVASRAILVQAGWLMAPLRLLQPYVLADKTVQTLRRTATGWLAAAQAATPGNGADQPQLRALGLEMKRVFREPLLADLRHRASNAMFTSAAAATAANLKPPRCVREYMRRAERGDPEAKLVFHARWGMLRLLRALGKTRFEIERVFLSEKGMPLWYPDPRSRESEIKQRKTTLANVFRRPLGDRHVACRTLALYGVCPFQGNVGACCAEQVGATGNVAGVWNPMQVAKLGAPNVRAELEPSSSLLRSLYAVPTPPERLSYASESQL